MRAATCSACGTFRARTVGAGGRLAGGSFGGLTRALLRGPRTVHATLWPMGDPATRRFQVPLCREVKAGASPPSALRTPILELRAIQLSELNDWRAEINQYLPVDERPAFQAAWANALHRLRPADLEDEDRP